MSGLRVGAKSAVSLAGCGKGYVAAMQSFEGKIAVVTGGGTGMGRELAVSLARAGAGVAMCDVHPGNLAETEQRCAAANGEVLITSHECDVSDEGSVNRFRNEVVELHGLGGPGRAGVERGEASEGGAHVNLLFNNAGIGGGGSFLEENDRERWERTFDVCWRGVYLCCRAFMPLLVASDEGHIINTSSVNGFWASVGPERPHSAYSAAKFAVKGFTEALLADLRLNAPHVGASVVMPGHIGTEIVTNSTRVHGAEVDAVVTEVANAFRNRAPTSAAEAADVILDGVLAGSWRILVGEDAHIVDSLVREKPEDAYEPSFIEELHSMGAFRGLLD